MCVQASAAHPLKAELLSHRGTYLARECSRLGGLGNVLEGNLVTCIGTIKINRKGKDEEAGRRCIGRAGWVKVHEMSPFVRPETKDKKINRAKTQGDEVGSSSILHVHCGRPFRIFLHLSNSL